MGGEVSGQAGSWILIDFCGLRVGGVVVVGFLASPRGWAGLWDLKLLCVGGECL